MKHLKQWVGKEVELVIQGQTKTYTYKGYIWRYQNPFYTRDKIEYYIGYDGGMMTQIRPSEVIEIKLIQRKYKYIVVDTADEWYEENIGNVFYSFEETYDFIIGNNKFANSIVEAYIEKLDYLEKHKESFAEWNGYIELVVSLR